MKQVAVLSGKGGTGKTSLVSAFARLADAPITLCDGDVDAANLALTFPGKDASAALFFSGQKAVIDASTCTNCGACLDVCRFDAIREGDTAPSVAALHCEGCRACSVVCGADAVSFVDHSSGRIFVRDIAEGVLVHAALGIAEGNSGKLVASVKEHAKKLAAERGSDLVLIDGPPGIGCPVHATLSGVDLVVAVTEPTPSGAADLHRLLDLSDHFGIAACVIVNKFDLSTTMTESIEHASKKRGAPPIGRIGFDTAVAKYLSRHRTLLDVPSVRAQIDALWQQVRRLL